MKKKLLLIISLILSLQLMACTVTINQNVDKAEPSAESPEIITEEASEEASESLVSISENNVEDTERQSKAKTLDILGYWMNPDNLIAFEDDHSYSLLGELGMAFGNTVKITSDAVYDSDGEKMFDYTVDIDSLTIRMEDQEITFTRVVEEVWEELYDERLESLF